VKSYSRPQVCEAGNRREGLWTSKEREQAAPGLRRELCWEKTVGEGRREKGIPGVSRCRQVKAGSVR